jgi:hypothetical protein
MSSRHSYPWRKVCDSVLQESDPVKASRLCERALSALEVRFAELGRTPATKTEQKAVLTAIYDMRQRLFLLQTSEESRLTPQGFGMRKPN